MANENICVFCGNKLGMFRASISCAGTYQPCCRDCNKGLKDLTEEEQCRRALRLGLVQDTQALEARIELADKALEVAANAEEHRLICLRCGAKLRFQAVEHLDNSAMRDSFFSDTFDVLPAYCESCGRYEFYNPKFVEKDEYLAHLIKTDTAEV